MHVSYVWNWRCFREATRQYDQCDGERENAAGSTRWDANKAEVAAQRGVQFERLPVETGSPRCDIISARTCAVYDDHLTT